MESAISAPAVPLASAHEAESEIVSIRRQIDGLVSKTELLERRVNEVVNFHNGNKHGSDGREPDLFHQFSAILSEITSHDLGKPFKEPVDIEALEHNDYHKIISKSMDFSTIQNKMEGKDGNEYNSVREICSDVRLIFSNAMKYNAEGHTVHRMAKTLLEIFEQKWLRFLPKVESEEKRQKEGESMDMVGTNTSREAAVAKLSKETNDELTEINKQLEGLRNMVVQRCRKMTIVQNRKLCADLCHLSPDDLGKALEIVAQDNPDFQTKAEEVCFDIDALSEKTLWRIKLFVLEALKRQANIVSGKMNENAKRKRDIGNAMAENALRRIKKQP